MKSGGRRMDDDDGGIRGGWSRVAGCHVREKERDWEIGKGRRTMLLSFCYG